MNYKNSKFHVENISIKKLTQSFQTPFYCYSKSRLSENIKNFNILYVTKQIEEINKGISLMKDNLRVYPSKTQIEIGKNWCIQYGLDINETFFNRRIYKR